MTGTIHVFEFLKTLPAPTAGGICPVFGNDRFLKQLAIQHLVPGDDDGDEDFGAVFLDGAVVEWVDVMDELSTRSLFGSTGPKTVVVDHGDAFVKENRDSLEKRLDTSDVAGLLVLMVDSWPANTRLYKRCDKSCVQVDCNPPMTKRGRSKSHDDAKTMKWLIHRANETYEFELPSAGAGVLVELTDRDFGRMDQELAKLSLYAIDEKLDPITIRGIVGGWPAQTMWEVIDAATEGDAGTAINLLDQLIRSGEHPLALLGQLAWSLRRYAEVGELVRRDHRQGRRINMEQTKKQAGFRSWGSELTDADRRLRQLGRDRIACINDWLLNADLALKRSHSHVDRGRLVLETLVTRMAQELSPASDTVR